jgi:hypothetical protein
MSTQRSQPVPHPRYGLILDVVKSHKATAAQPGKPLNHIPLVSRPELNAAIEDGKVRVITRPGTVNPNLEVKFLVLGD